MTTSIYKFRRDLAPNGWPRYVKRCSGCRRTPNKYPYGVTVSRETPIFGGEKSLHIFHYCVNCAHSRIKNVRDEMDKVYSEKLRYMQEVLREVNVLIGSAMEKVQKGIDKKERARHA